MKKINIEEEFKKLTTTKGVDPQKQEIAPYRDWRILVVTFFVGLAVSFAYNIYMAVQINKDSFFATEARPAGVTKFNDVDLAKVITVMDQKAALFEKTKTENISIVDPSI